MNTRPLPLWQVDAFASEPFTGNPAAVVTFGKDSMLDETLMQRIANENNLSETAFVWPVGPNTYGIRWFTPNAEIDLCGHATLAAAHVMFSVSGTVEGDAITFQSKSGDLGVRRLDDNRLELDFPAKPVTPRDVDDALCKALGATPLEVHVGDRDLLAVFQRREDIEAITPDFGALAKLDKVGIIATASDDTGDVDFVSRFFAPAVGVPEDPVTGSAHCALAPFWGERLGTDTMTARQLSPRGGHLTCTLDGDRVRIAGHTVEVLRGIMNVPVE